MDEKIRNKVSREVAEDQLGVLIDYYDIDRDDIEMEDGPAKVKTIQNRLIRAIESGNLEISLNDGVIKVVQILKNDPGEIGQIEYSEISSKHKLVMDTVSEVKSTARMHAFMGSVSGLGAAAFGKLKGSDMGVMEKLAVLFMVV